MNISTWWTAFRPNTLIVSIAPVFIGISLSIRDNNFSSYFVAILTLLAAILIQIGTNLINDLYDYIKGADNKHRVGPIRATQSGLLSKNSIQKGAFFCFTLALLIGIYLVYIGGVPILVIGLLSLISGYCYTAGPYPLAYNGLGDIFVFIFFGLIAVPGTYYLQSNILFDINSILIGSSIGFLAVAVLCVNNIRDIESDSKVGKKTLVVRFGVNIITIVYDIMIISAYVSILIFMLIEGIFNQSSMFLLFLSFPIAIKLIVDIHKSHGQKLNLILFRTAILIRTFAILLIIGILL